MGERCCRYPEDHLRCGIPCWQWNRPFSWIFEDWVMDSGAELICKGRTMDGRPHYIGPPGVIAND